MSTSPPPPPAAQPLDLAAVTNAHIKIRDARAQLKKNFELQDNDLKASQEKLEAVMLSHLNHHGMESVRTEAGTFYRQEDLIPSIADDTAFYGWIREHNAFDALERRVKKTFIKDFAEQHEGQLPPGINTHRQFVVRVRRAS